MSIWYATREDVKDALDAKETARANSKIDRAIGAATQAVEGLCHRRFYPELASRSWDWPNGQTAHAWRLWLDDNELISLTSLTSGGRALDLEDVFLRRSDGREEPPFTHIELNIGSSAAFGGGSTTQRDITVQGLFGYRNDETTLGTHTGITSGATTLTVDAVTSAAVGVGSLLRLDEERVTVTARSMASTGQTLTAPVDAQMKTTTLPVTNGTAFAEGELILLDGERCKVDEIAGNNLIVRRAADGSTLAAHEAATPVYAPRSLRLRRGVLGTTATAHTNGGAVVRWDPPALVNELCIAQAMTNLLQGAAGYARTVGSGEGQREAAGRGLAEIRDDTYTAHGRKARSRAV
ncbi:hypothetical protein ACIRF8_12910 [Streptomyces sp. NPDC102406]|uniref:hypothetical protein n=1 Tax=Streptomyces sp. NPDC102406 TaxID=3366171 RepID=UPI0038074EC8